MENKEYIFIPKIDIHCIVEISFQMKNLICEKGRFLFPQECAKITRVIWLNSRSNYNFQI